MPLPSPPQILDEGENLRPLHEMKDLNEAVSDIKYAPNNKFMAVASNATVVDIYK